MNPRSAPSSQLIARQQMADRPGFTLLELLIAISITAVISVSLYASLRTAFKARETAQRSVEPARTAELAFDFLRSDIESAVVPNGTLRGPFVGTDLPSNGGGDGDYLEFYTLGNSQADSARLGVAGEVRRVELQVAADANNGRDQVLLRRVYGNLLATVEPLPYDEIICRGLVGMNLRYFDGYSWLDSWDSTQNENAIPSAVEVTLEFRQPGNLQTQGGVIRYQRVFLLSTSTVSATSGQTTGTSTTGGGL